MSSKSGAVLEFAAGATWFQPRPTRRVSAPSALISSSVFSRDAGSVNTRWVESSNIDHSLLLALAGVAARALSEVASANAATAIASFERRAADIGRRW